MAGRTCLIVGVMLLAAAAPALAQDPASCAEELLLVQARERYLKYRVERQEALLNRLQLLCNKDPPQRDCADVFTSGSKTSGLYAIRPLGSPAPVQAYCDMSDGGGWTVVQRRIDGSELFNRSWTEYKNGFGDKSEEFWFGNDILHYLTDQGSYSVRINLGDFEGSQSYAEYNDFKVGPEESDYLLSFGAYSGTAGDALSGNYRTGVSLWASHQGAKFTTYDRDNDNLAWGNCAQEDKGGWWFNRCHSAHLNGLYYPSGPYSAVTDDGIVWVTWRGWWYSLKTTVMKLRPADFKEDPSTT
ncbi:fibrinogen-like protein 1 [Gadus morhua]|uniref:fibrinogen-like protein 1 n=1 Tax=Gadus morhua TaxID=8049 RepID=UPI0011B41481|nr:fibrinogen-like protein 1 [Gadus morhua]XP_030223810.1 fibrinogen-like protein 1 [Gadus morhua]